MDPVQTLALSIQGVAVVVLLQFALLAWLTVRIWRLEAHAEAVERRLRFRVEEADQSAAAGT